MVNVDLSNLSLEELIELQASIAQAIAGFEGRRRAEALRVLEDTARKHGFSLTALTGAKVRRSRSPALVKYINPTDASQTWTGRGRQPLWLSHALASGSRLADFVAEG